MANYPTSVPSFTNKSAGQTIASAHINSLQDEVVAIGGGLLNGFAHVLASTGSVRLQFKQSMAKATSTGLIGVADNTLTTVGLGSEDFDTDGLHDNATNNSRLTAKVDGKYLVTAYANWSINSSGTRQLRLARNSTTIAQVQQPGFTAGGVSQIATDLIALSAGHYVEMHVYQNSGSTTSIASASLSMVYVGE
jgi:hypothetical protein